jgi:manganese/zinc/iron transport system substrate-binding protein
MVALGAAAACAEDAPAPPKSLDVITTVGMIADITRGVAGEHAEVTSLMGAGVDPHLYKPTRTDIQRLLEADIVFYNGLLLEGRMTDSLVRAATSGKHVHPVTEGIDDTFLLEPPEFQGHADPHVWMDPKAWAEAVEVVRDRLIEVDTANTSEYQVNAATTIAKITELDAYAERVLKTVPESQRVLVTAHDAFNYFGRRYGFEVVGIQGISTESEAGVRDIERLVELLVSKKIPAVFVESTVSQRNIDALRAGAKARGHEVVIGGTLFSDAMGPDGTYEGTYIGMIDHNVTTIARALGGDAPAHGMQGKLTP